MTHFAGVDIAGRAAHIVMVDDSLAVVRAWVSPPEDVGELAEELASCKVVAIDSPDRWSPGAIPEHSTESPKFRSARCAEIGLGRLAGYWVPWATPSRPVTEDEQRRYAWMAAGIDLFDRLRDRTTAIEVYPHSVFRHLNAGKPLIKKSTLAGLSKRVAILRELGSNQPHLEMWSHDALDAYAAAAVALRHAEGRASRFTCGHDGSAIWLA